MRMMAIKGGSLVAIKLVLIASKIKETLGILGTDNMVVSIARAAAGIRTISAPPQKNRAAFAGKGDPIGALYSYTSCR